MPRLQTVYDENELPAFTPMEWKLTEIRAAIPARLFVRDTRKGLYYLIRDILLAAAVSSLALRIDPLCRSLHTIRNFNPFLIELMRWSAWCIYWWFQGLIFTGIWVIGHECGHGAFSDHKFINDLIGFVTHTFLWTPYFSWKISHHRHHSNHASMERDEVYIPQTRADLRLPEDGDPGLDYSEILGDTPVYTLYILIRRQVLAFPAYLLFNVSGQNTYPKWTNHFNRESEIRSFILSSRHTSPPLIARSILFTPSQRNAVMISNAGILFMICAVRRASWIFGLGTVIKYYGIPWLLVTHWFIMITYLHHTDPVIPHYRGAEWNFQRGAAATVDRPILGWQGRFFLHDVAHFHVVHHFFPKIPFYHTPEATKYLKAFLGDHYARDDTPAFKALWRNYNLCQFVENEGDVLFYRNRQGQAVRRPTIKREAKNK